MRKILFLLLFIPVATYAQNLHLKFGGGFSSHYGRAQVVGAFKLGLGYEIEFNQHWSFTPSLEVYGKGWKDPNETVFVFDREGNQMFDEETGKPLLGIKIAPLLKTILRCLCSLAIIGVWAKVATLC